MKVRFFDTATTELIRRTGFVLLVIGGAAALLTLAYWDALPNWLAIAAMIPVMAAFPMVRIDLYKNWHATKGLERGWAIGALSAPPMLLLGSMIWFFAVPHAHG